MRGRPVWFWAILAAQVLVPLVQLTADRPARFGWQMFSTALPPIAFQVQYSNGTLETVQPRDVLATQRQEIDLEKVLPPYLCDRSPEVAAVTVVRGDVVDPAATMRCR